ncbi:hypothetical protein [Hyphomicrobium sp. 2TAF46]|uniref:hypothetical protein n=1 Tax=Hyphomicrobium sp. 2TAF46 TaxID=3233019 RepID=UPI003F9035B8
MPWDGSGNFSLAQDFSADRDAGPPASLIGADKMMDVLQDIAAGLMLCIQRGGQNTPTSDIRWGNYRIRDLARGSIPTDAVNASQVAEALVTYCGLTAGTAAAITATNSFMSEVAVGTTVRATALNANADNATLVCAGSTGNIIEKDGNQVKAGRIVAGKLFACTWDGSHWVLIETGSKPFDAAIVALNALAQLVPAADNLAYFNGGTTAALTSLTAYARTLLAATDASALGAIIGLPAGTLMSFFQTAAPTGWTKSTTHNDKIPRIVSGTAGNGGSTPFSTVFAPRTVARANLPNVTLAGTGTTDTQGSHSHTVTAPAVGTSGNDTPNQPKWTVMTTTNYGNLSVTSSTNGSHSHNVNTNSESMNGGVTQTTIDFAVQYVDCIIAAKN